MKTSFVYGFTLIELLTTIVVAGLILTIGLPAFMDTVQNNRLSAKINELVTDFNLARSEALKRGKFVTLCKPNTSATACDDSAGWRDGWIVFADDNGNGSVDSSDVILRVHGTLTGLTSVHYLKDRVTFTGSGFTIGVVNGTITFCDSRGAGKAKGLVLSNTGRLRSAGSDDTLECP